MIAEYMCQCLPGFAGKYCENEINECDSNPCHNNGVCTDLLAAYSCSCTEDYAGPQCDTLKQVTCENQPCQSGAVCTDGFSKFFVYCFAPKHTHFDSIHQMLRPEITLRAHAVPATWALFATNRSAKSNRARMRDFVTPMIRRCVSAALGTREFIAKRKSTSAKRVPVRMVRVFGLWIVTDH